jgi:hypothetical protein
MTTPRIDELRRLEAAATPGPWPDLNGELFSYAKPAHTVASVYRAEDAAFICTVRDALPLLLDGLEALREFHEYHCGCDQPGRLDFCVAKPTSTFAVLAALDGVASAGEERT